MKDSQAEKRLRVKDVLVIGVDVAKTGHIATAKAPSGAVSRPCGFANDRCGFEAFLRAAYGWQRQAGATSLLVGLEPTGPYWEALGYWLVRQGIPVVQVNPAHTRWAKELADNSPRKTDAKDAGVIADLVSQGKFLSLSLPTGVFAELRALATRRAELVRQRTALVNRVHQLVDRLFPELPQLFKKLTQPTVRALLAGAPTPQHVLALGEEGVTELLRRASHGRLGRPRARALLALAEHSVSIREGTEGWALALRQILAEVDSVGLALHAVERRLVQTAGQVPYACWLLSLPQVGPLTVALLLAEIGDWRAYRRAEAVIKLAGLNLYEVSSGLFHGQVRITRRGRPRLRTLLFMAALRLVKRGSPFHADYGRLIGRGVVPLKAVVAVARKLVRIAHALVRDERPFREAPQAA